MDKKKKLMIAGIIALLLTSATLLFLSYQNNQQEFSEKTREKEWDSLTDEEKRYRLNTGTGYNVE